MGWDWTSSGVERQSKIFLTVVSFLPFFNNVVSFSGMFCCFIYCLLFFRLLFSFSGGRGGTGQATGRDGAWWDKTSDGWRWVGCGGTINGAGRTGRAVEGERRETRDGAGKDK